MAFADGLRLGIDFGTSNTVAVLGRSEGQVRPLLFDGLELLPSAVYAEAWSGGTSGLLVGRDAMHAARARPECFEPYPKRRIDEGTVLLGEAEVPVTDLVAAVLGRVAAEARRVTGNAPAAVTLTCPAGWGPRRRGVLLAAAGVAGLANVSLVAEPVAAANYFVAVAGHTVPVGSCVVVYDFGAGTFDASVVRRTGGGFEVLADEGLADVGGLDVDMAVVAHLGATYASRNPDAWQRLTHPSTAAERRAHRTLWEDVRAGKEMLSRTGSTLVHLPLLDDDAPVGREQLEQLAGPILARTVTATRSVLRTAQVNVTALAGVFLVGGSSRIPLVATLLHRGLGVAPTVIEQPELVVAEGSLRTRTLPTAVPPAAPPPAAPPPAAPPPAPPQHTVLIGGPGPAIPNQPSGPDPSWPEPTPSSETLLPPVATPSRRRTVRTLAVGAFVLALTVAGLFLPRLFSPAAQSGQPARSGQPGQSGRPTQASQPAQSGSSAPASPSSQAGSSTGPSWAAVAVLTGPTEGVDCMAFSPDGRTLAAGSYDRRAWLWDVTGPRAGKPLTGHTDGVGSAAFSPDGRTLATASLDKTARLWDVATRQQVSVLTGHTDKLRNLAFSPDGRTLATASDDHTVRLWDLTTRQPDGEPLTGHTNSVSSVAFSPDGRTLATGSNDMTGRLWDLTTRQPTGGPLTGHTGYVRSVAFSPDGHILATASYDRTVRLWDVATHRQIGVLTGHTDKVSSAAFSRDGRTLATTSYDHTVRLWDVATHQQIGTPLTGHTDAVWCAAFSPDGRTLATGSADKTARLWQVDR